METLTQWARRIVLRPSFDITILALIVVSVILLGVEIALPESDPYYAPVETAGDVITLIFVFELLLRFIVSKKKRRFFREYFIDILAVLPVFRVFRFLRFLRLLRLLRLFRVLSLVANQTRILQWLLRKRITEYLIVSALLIFATLFGTLGMAHFQKEPSDGASSLAEAFWMTVFSLVAGEYVDEFPATLGGKLVILFIKFCGLTLFALLTGTISVVMIEKLKDGAVLNRLTLEDLENHIIICGYNAGVETVLAEFQSHPTLKEREIVIITERAERVNMDIPYPGRVRVIEEDFTRAEVLQRCNVNACDIAVIVSDVSGSRSRQDADARTVLAALTIEKLNPSVHTCAELSNGMNEPHLRMGGVNEVIVTRSISGHLLAQAALHSGSAHLLQELLKPSEGHTFTPSPVPEEFFGKSFAEVLAAHYDKTDTIPIALERKDGTLLVNPKNEILQEGDHLICVSYNGSSKK